MAKAQPDKRRQLHNDLEEWQEGRWTLARANPKPWGENVHEKKTKFSLKDGSNI
jgi:hypothetical protein